MTRGFNHKLLYKVQSFSLEHLLNGMVAGTETVEAVVPVLLPFAQQ